MELVDGERRTLHDVVEEAPRIEEWQAASQRLEDDGPDGPDIHSQGVSQVAVIFLPRVERVDAHDLGGKIALRANHRDEKSVLLPLADAEVSNFHPPHGTRLHHQHVLSHETWP